MDEQTHREMDAATDSLTSRVRTVLERLATQYGNANWEPSGLPVDELVGTILSQNTTDVNTDRAFRSLRANFPTWADVRDAPTEAVTESIRMGGLAQQKAPRIQQVLGQILSPDSADANRALLEELTTLGHQESMRRLTSLSGVGPKTAACVLLFAVGLPAIPVDTHVHRVSQRLGLISERTDANRAHDELLSLVPPSAAYQFHVHLIQHGRQVCRARVPRCESCTLSDVCPYGQRKLARDSDTTTDRKVASTGEN